MPDPTTEAARSSAPDGPPEARRHRLPPERRSRTHKFSVGGHEGYVIVGLYANGDPGEIFVRMAKEGSVVSGLMDSLSTAVSIALQHGVPLHVLVDKFRGTRFEPYGFTGNSEIPTATSIMDYLFRWLEVRFPRLGPRDSAQPSPSPATALTALAEPAPAALAAHPESSAPSCRTCGTLMTHDGARHVCPSCGAAAAGGP